MTQTTTQVKPETRVLRLLSKSSTIDKHNEEDEPAMLLPLFKNLQSGSPTASKVLILPQIKGKLELIISFQHVLSPPLILYGNHVFRKDVFTEGRYNNMKSVLKNATEVEKAINHLSIYKLFNVWPDEEEERKVAQECTREIANWIKGQWTVYLQNHDLSKGREFCVDVIEDYDTTNEMPSYAVTFYEVREDKRLTFSQLVEEVYGETFPSYYMHRLNTLFRGRYFKQLPEEKDSPLAKPGSGTPALYRFKRGKKILVEAGQALVDSLRSSLTELEDADAQIERRIISAIDTKNTL